MKKKSQLCYYKAQMAKKRRTKKEKIIAQLRRQLAWQEKNLREKQSTKSAAKKNIKTEKKEINNKLYNKQKTTVILAYDPQLIKKDILKTSLISVIFFILIIILKFFLFK